MESRGAISSAQVVPRHLDKKPAWGGVRSDLSIGLTRLSPPCGRRENPPTHYDRIGRGVRGECTCACSVPEISPSLSLGYSAAPPRLTCSYKPRAWFVLNGHSPSFIRDHFGYPRTLSRRSVRRLSKQSFRHAVRRQTRTFRVLLVKRGLVQPTQHTGSDAVHRQVGHTQGRIFDPSLIIPLAITRVGTF